MSRRSPVFFWLLAGMASISTLYSCTESKGPAVTSKLNLPPKPNPEKYVCYLATSAVIIDGKLDEALWDQVPWTNPFQDIEGSANPAPKYETRAKMLWDNENLYVAAELEEPHIWANLRQRDTVIFYDNDFEVFIDPDGDTHAYYELEVNALGTAWDLLLLKPYRDGGPPVNGWDIAGLKVGIDIQGTINNPSDIDSCWTVELAIPMAALKECAAGGKIPEAGDQWRIGFSRVEWRTVVENGRYKKEINPATGKPFPEDNWVWSPQGRINMHMPEMWGYVQFSSKPAGIGSEPFVDDIHFDAKWALRTVYYAEFEYYARNLTYSSSLVDLGLKKADFPESLPLPIINSTRMTFECYIPSPKGKASWIIFQDGRISNLPDSLSR